jgi:hypothetical protein
MYGFKNGYSALSVFSLFFRGRSWNLRIKRWTTLRRTQETKSLYHAAPSNAIYSFFGFSRKWSFLHIFGLYLLNSSNKLKVDSKIVLSFALRAINYMIVYCSLAVIYHRVELFWHFGTLGSKYFDKKKLREIWNKPNTLFNCAESGHRIKSAWISQIVFSVGNFRKHDEISVIFYVRKMVVIQSKYTLYGTQR